MDTVRNQYSDPVFLDNFFMGVNACQDGQPCPDWQSQAFKAGYAMQYELEQRRTARAMERS
jgi:hypothetical protein